MLACKRQGTSSMLDSCASICNWVRILGDRLHASGKETDLPTAARFAERARRTSGMAGFAYRTPTMARLSLLPSGMLSSQRGGNRPSRWQSCREATALVLQCRRLM